MSNNIDLKIEPQFSPDKAFASLDARHVQKALRAATEAAIDEIKEQVKQGFAQQKTPGGANWKPLSEGYAKWKQKHFAGKPILQLHEDLIKAATNPSVEWGNGGTEDGDGGGGQGGDNQGATVEATLTVKDPKAKTHQFGRGPIPARPFFSFEGQAEKEILAKAFEAFDKQIAKGS